MRKKQRVIAGASLAAGLVAGGGAGLIVGASAGSVGASSAAPAVVTDPTTPTSDPSGSTGDTGTSGDTDAPKPAADREQRVRALLQPLVDDGTITAAQLDAIVAKLATAEPVKGFGDHGGPGRRGGIARIDVDTVATVLGISADDVRTALRDGTTLKALAESKGKTAQDVIDAIVAATKAELDQRVADGSVTQAEADTKLAEATTRITEVVDNGFASGLPDGPDGPRGDRRPGGRPGKPVAPSTDATPATPSSTPPTTTG